MLRLSIAAAGLAAFLPVLMPAQTAKSYKDIVYPKLNPIRVPAVERYVLPNGMTVFLVEDKELPTFTARAMIRGGDRNEPAGKAGLAGITLRVMREGGTKSRSGESLDEELDRLAAVVELGAGETSSAGTVAVLKEDAEKGLTILTDLLQNPVFPQDKIDLAKTDIKDGIARRNDDPMGIHGRERVRLLYGKNSPYTAQPEYATLEAITRDDLVTFHQKIFQPENVILGVWGDFDKAQMKALIARTLGGWPKGGEPKPEVPGVDTAAQAKGLHLIQKDDVNQSIIGMSLLAGKLSDADAPAMAVMTTILGGGFGSRLFDNIRTKEGLAYMANAGYSAQYDYPGSWSATTGTKSETTAKALESMRREIGRMRDEIVTEVELQRAKDKMLKAEAFDFDSTGKIVGRLMTYEYFGYPADFLAKYRAGVEKVTREDVQRVAKQYLVDSNFVTLVLGKPADFGEPLTKFGTPTPVDITIPEPKAAPVGEATAETASKGLQLMQMARKAHGGAALDSVKDYATKVDIVMVTPQGEMAMKGDGIVSTAGKNRIKMMSPMGEIVQGFDGQVLWLKTPQGMREMPASQIAQAKQSVLRETISLLRNFDKPGYKVQAIGESELGGKKVEGVAVSYEPAQFQMKVFVDPATGLLAGKSYMGQGMMGSPGEVVETYADIRDVGGVKLPFQSVLMTGGNKTGEQRYSEVTLNPGAPDSEFAKPAQ